VRKRVCLLFFLLLIESCTFYRIIGNTKLKTPEFTILGCEVRKMSHRQANVHFIVSAYNPNPIGLKNVYVNYELSTENKRFMKGRDVSIELAPNSENKIIVPAEIDLDDLSQVIGPLLEKILSHQKTIPIRIDALFYGKPTAYNDFEEGSLFSFERRVTKTVDIPLPKDEIEKVKKQLLNEIKKRF
jgi:LEA14-like dessication related protein